MILPTGRSRIRSASSPAFTLIELILVMAILVVMISLSAPKLGSFFRGRALDSEARRLLSLSRYGQGRAASEGIPMVMWLDVKNRVYGLREETSYEPVDPKAVEYPLGKGLELELRENAMSRSNRMRLPSIRFLPDGSISDSSPMSVRVYDREDGASYWLSQSRNRLNYEIKDQPETQQRTRQGY